MMQIIKPKVHMPDTRAGYPHQRRGLRQRRAAEDRGGSDAGDRNFGRAQQPCDGDYLVHVFVCAHAPRGRRSTWLATLLKCAAWLFARANILVILIP